MQIWKQADLSFCPGLLVFPHRWQLEPLTTYVTLGKLLSV